MLLVLGNQSMLRLDVRGSAVVDRRLFERQRKDPAFDELLSGGWSQLAETDPRRNRLKGDYGSGPLRLSSIPVPRLEPTPMSRLRTSARL